MGVYLETELRKSILYSIAEKMAIAARTAPKAKGIDNLVIAIIDGEEIKKVSDKMLQMFEEGRAQDFFARDSKNLLVTEAIVLIGTKISPIGLKFCGLCGFENCEEKLQHPNHPCAFNTGDLGIALGSAASTAMDFKVDNRIMYTIGKACKELNILGEEVKILYGIPLSGSGKSPYFDRK
jgi:uncharacterized ferredoxin-like protein